jgi:hypothetical protein
MVQKQKCAKGESRANVVPAAKAPENIHLIRSVLSIRIGRAEKAEIAIPLAKVETIILLS